MFKKIKKTLGKEFKKRYEQLEGQYLGLENRVYSTIEARMNMLEEKFEELSDLLKEELRARRTRNEEKLEEMEADEDDDDDVLFSETMEEMKEALSDDLKEVKESIAEKTEAVSKQVKKATKMVTGTIKKATQKKDPKSKKETNPSDKKEGKNAPDDLSKIKGLGEKLAEKLAEQGITSYNQLASLTQKEVEALDEKIKSFAARFARYEWAAQAKELKK